MKKQVFMHKQTGEIIHRYTHIGAYLYFKADGKRFGYITRRGDVLDADGVRKTYGLIIDRG